MQQVHVRINDAATGKPTPCRVRFTDAEGTYYAPLGRLTEFATSYGVDVGGNVIADGKKYAYIDGTCEIGLPPGKLLIEVHKGFEYKPLHEEIQLQPGKLALRLTLERWIDMRAEGWYSGDTRCHFLTPHGALLEGMAEDLAVVNLLAMECQIPQTDDAGEQVTSQTWAMPNILAFSGQQPALETPGHMVVVNTLNWHPWLGRLALLNCHRVVYPLRFGAPGNDDWTLSDWCDQCHRKGGLVVWTDARYRGEGLAAAISGRVDAIEIESRNWVDDWLEFKSGCPASSLAGCGIELPYVGASGKASNADVLGGVRTYAFLGREESFSYGAWIDAIRSGRSVVTKGPLLQMTLNGQHSGKNLNLSAATPNVKVNVFARSWTPFDHVEVWFPGGTMRANATGLPFSATIDETIQIPHSGWIQARCCPSQLSDQQEVAFTSPVRISVGEQLPEPDNRHGAVLSEFLLASLKRLDLEARFANDAQRQGLRKVFGDAIQILNQRANA